MQKLYLRSFIFTIYFSNIVLKNPFNQRKNTLKSIWENILETTLNKEKERTCPFLIFALKVTGLTKFEFVIFSTDFGEQQSNITPESFSAKQNNISQLTALSLR